MPKGARPKRATNNNAYIPQSMVSSLQTTASTAQTGSKEEDERISKMMSESTSHWVHTQQQSQQQQGHQVRRVSRPKGPNPVPPPTYTCFRCGQPGHYINFCPTNDDPTFDRPRIKKTTGIPRAFLRTVDPHMLDNPSTAIMVTSEGAAVIATPNESEWERVTAERHQHPTCPTELKCVVCEDLLNNPRRLACCKTVCCADCLQVNEDDEGDPTRRQVTCPSCRRVTLLKTVTVAEDVQERLYTYLNSTSSSLPVTAPPAEEPIKHIQHDRPADGRDQPSWQRREQSPRRRHSSRSPPRRDHRNDPREVRLERDDDRRHYRDRRDDRMSHRRR